MMRKAVKLFQRIIRDEQGVTIIEFAFVAPILCMLLIGLFDLGLQIYAQTSMTGALQEAARKSSLEPTVYSIDALDEEVEKSVYNIIANADVSFERKNYQTFSDINKPEDFTDSNNNGVCDDDEPFEDLNNNGNWDQDRGRDGLGGARDAVLYTVTASYDRILPLHNFINVSEQVEISATTVLRNQPYNAQSDRVPEVGACE